MRHLSMHWGLLLASLVLAGFATGCARYIRSVEPEAQVTVAAQSLATASANPAPEVAPAAQVYADQEAALLPEVHTDLSGMADLTRYSVELDIDYAARRFSGVARVDYTNTEARALDSLYFRLLPNGGKSYGNGRLEVSQALVAGIPAQVENTLSGSALEIKLTVALEPGAGVQLEIEFFGEVPLEFGGTDEPAGYGIYNLSQGVMTLSGWYPILAVYDEQGWNLDPVSAIGDSVYSDTAFYEVFVTAPADLVLAATGIQLERKDVGTEAHYTLMSGPVRDFTLVLSPDFEVVSSQVGGTQIHSYYLPGDEAGGLAALEVATASLQTFNRRFGVYPYTELDVVEIPMRYASGVEFPAIVLIASSLYDDPKGPAFSVTTAHEVAHQWWYSLVGNDVFESPWLDEALATYSSGLYYQDILGESAYQGLVGYWEQRYAELVQSGRDDLVTEELAYFESANPPRSYGGVVYTKGALFLAALRTEIGDQAFFEALQRYYQGQKYGIAEADDLLGAFEAAAGKSLDGLYQQWLFSAQIIPNLGTPVP